MLHEATGTLPKASNAVLFWRRVEAFWPRFLSLVKQALGTLYQSQIGQNHAEEDQEKRKRERTETQDMSKRGKG